MVIYLKKAERYEVILNAAMKMIIESGIASITARKIAAEANISVGQIHHHFETIGQLKGLALLKVTDQIIQKSLEVQKELSIIEQIISAVRPIESDGDFLIRRLWNEALFLSYRDQDIKNAYKQSIEEWHAALIHLLEKAISEKQITPCDVSDLAWRLIALGCGLDNLVEFDEFKFNQAIMDNHIRALLK